MMFITYCFVQAGSKAFKRGEKWAYCPFAVDDARAQKGTSIVALGQERSGDIVFFSWKRDGVANHVGMLISVNKNGTILTLEGNTGTGNDSDGGEVQVRTRDVADVLCYVRAVI
jgi:cell wall-associated NlpC family hydrolase